MSSLGLKPAFTRGLGLGLGFEGVPNPPPPTLWSGTGGGGGACACGGVGAVKLLSFGLGFWVKRCRVDKGLGRVWGVGR